MRSLFLIPALLLSFGTLAHARGGDTLTPAARASARAKIRANGRAFVQSLPSFGMGAPIERPGYSVKFDKSGEAATALISGQGKKVRYPHYDARFQIEASATSAKVTLLPPG